MTDEFCTIKQNKKEKVSWDLEKKKRLFQCNIMHAIMISVKHMEHLYYKKDKP